MSFILGILSPLFCLGVVASAHRTRWELFVSLEFCQRKVFHCFLMDLQTPEDALKIDSWYVGRLARDDCISINFPPFDTCLYFQPLSFLCTLASIFSKKVLEFGFPPKGTPKYSIRRGWLCMFQFLDTVDNRSNGTLIGDIVDFDRFIPRPDASSKRKTTCFKLWRVELLS